MYIPYIWRMDELQNDSFFIQTNLLCSHATHYVEKCQKNININSITTIVFINRNGP